MTEQIYDLPIADLVDIFRVKLDNIESGNAGACPFCGSDNVMVHNIRGVTPADNDSEHLCMSCEREW